MTNSGRPHYAERRLIEVIVGPCGRDIAEEAATAIEGWLSEGFPALGAAAAVRYSRDGETEDMDMGPFDPDDLVRWAVLYGHPEGWCKRAQAAHSRAEKAQARLVEVEVERERDAAKGADSRMCDILQGERDAAEYHRRREHTRGEEYREALEHVLTVATISTGEEMRACREIADLVSRVLSPRQVQPVIPSSRASGMLSSHPKGIEASHSSANT